MFKQNFEKSSELLNLDRVYQKVENIIKDDRIDIDGFQDLYGEGQVKRDKEYVEKMNGKFDQESNYKDKENKKIATIFEGIIGEQAELSEWLGSDINTIFATEYDDIVNGIDIIAEFSENKTEFSHLGLAVDATYSNQFSEKILKIKENIKKGKLATIKYFESSDMDFKGQLSQIPRVVIASDFKTVIELVELWDTGKKEDLANHPIQFQILEQIIMQLKTFKEYAQKIEFVQNVDSDRMIKKFELFIDIFDNIYKNRQKNVVDDNRRDGSTDKIKMYLNQFFK